MYYYTLADYADVVRDAQQVVELFLKAVLILRGVNHPKSHDVGQCFLDNHDLFPDLSQHDVNQIRTISKQLRRDRELAFYGAEDLIPLDYYQKIDADEAMSFCHWIYTVVNEIMQSEHNKIIEPQTE